MNIFKKSMCAFLCASILLTATTAQAGWWSSVCNFFSSTQNRVVAVAAVVGLAAVSYYLFANTSSAEKQAKKKADRELAMQELQLQAFSKTVEFLRQNNSQEFQKVIKANPKIWCWNNNGKTLLMHIVENFRSTGFMPDFSNETVQNITMFNIKDQDGKTVLMYAVAAVNPGEQKDKVEFIKKLIEKKDADVLAVDNAGNTALHYAAYTGCVTLVELILRKMIEKDPSKNPLSQKNVSGLTVQDVAMRKHQDNQKSIFKRDDVEVLVYLQNTVFDLEEARIRQSRVLTLDQLVQEFFENEV